MQTIINLQKEQFQIKNPGVKHEDLITSEKTKMPARKLISLECHHLVLSAYVNVKMCEFM